MKKTGKKFFSVIMAALVVLTTTVSAFALMENVSTINTDRTGSLIFTSTTLPTPRRTAYGIPATSPPVSASPAWRTFSAVIRERAR